MKAKRKIEVHSVYGNRIANITGPSSSLRRFLDRLECFESAGVQLELVTLDRYETHDSSVARPASNGVKRSSNAVTAWLRVNAKKRIAWLSGHSKWAAIAIIYLRFFRGPRKLIKRYLKSGLRAPDVLIFHDVFCAYYYLKKVGKQERSRFAIFYHNDGDLWRMLLGYYPKIRATWFHEFLRTIELKVTSAASCIVFVSDHCRQNFIARGLPTDARLVRLYNGSEDLGYRLVDRGNVGDTERINIVCVGSLSERKGQRRLLSAVAACNSALRDRISITLVGDGADRNKLEAEANRLHMGESVIFAGQQPRVDVYMHAADVFVLASSDEGLPVSIIEAMSAGLPVVATRVGGIPELVEHMVNGLLIGPTISDLTSALEQLTYLNLQSMGAASRDRFEHEFRIEKMIRGYCDIAWSICESP